MKLEEKDKRYLNLALATGLLILYFLGVSLFGVSVVVPFAFLWLMWTLNGIKKAAEKRAEEMEKIVAR